jgi:putative ABC transport system permease protein
MMLDIAFHNLRHHRLRTLLTILGVAAALQLYLTMNNLIVTFETDMLQQYQAFAGKVYVEQSLTTGEGWQGFPSTASSIDAVTASSVLSLADIDRENSSAAIFVPLVPSTIPNNPPYVLIVGIESGHEQALLSTIDVESGTSTLEDERSVILGHGAATYFGRGSAAGVELGEDTLYSLEGDGEPVMPGDRIDIQGQAFNVTGILEQGTQFLNGVVMMDIDVAQDLFNRPGAVSAIILTADSVDDVDQLQSAVANQFEGLIASSEEGLVAKARQWVDVQNTFFGMINNSVIAFVIVVVTIVMIVAVMERRREIGILRAVGAKRRTILGLILTESLSISLLGALTALPISIVFSRLLWSMTIDITVVLAWLPVVAVAIPIGVLASLLPAWQAVRVDPLNALKYE